MLGMAMLGDGARGEKKKGKGSSKAGSIGEGKWRKKETEPPEREEGMGCPRQQDIVQIAESGDIDHRGAAAAEPPGTDTSDLTVLLRPLLPRPLLPSTPDSIVRRRVLLETVPRGDP